MSSWYVCMYVWNLFLLLTFHYMLINVDYTITYFLPIPSIVPQVLERDLSCSTSLSYRPVYQFYQLYLYQLSAATNSGSLLPFEYASIYSPNRTHLVGSLLAMVLSIFIAFRRFFVGCGLRDRFQPLPSHRLWLRIKNTAEAFLGKHGRLVAALGWLAIVVRFLLPAYLLRWGYHNLPLSIRFGETLEPVQEIKLRTWHAPAQPALLWTRYISWNKRWEMKRGGRKGIEPGT